VAGFLVKGGEVLASSQDNGRAIDMGEKNTGEGDRIPLTGKDKMRVHLSRLLKGEKHHGINDYMVETAFKIMRVLYLKDIEALSKKQFLYGSRLLHLGFKSFDKEHLNAMHKLRKGHRDTPYLSEARCARPLDQISKDDVEAMVLLHRNPGNRFSGIRDILNQPSDVVIQATKYLLNIDDQELRTTFRGSEIIAYIKLCCDMGCVTLEEPTVEEIKVVADLFRKLVRSPEISKLNLTEEEQSDLLREVTWRIRTFGEIPNALARHTSPYDARNDIFSDHDEMQIVWIRPGAVILKNTGDIFRVNDKFVVKRGDKSHLKSCWKSGKIREIWITDDGLHVFNDTHGFKKPKGTGDDCQCPYQQITGKTVTFNALRSAGDEAYIFEGLKEF
jgi:hypothetical protein